jgi:hypothetical protein
MSKRKSAHRLNYASAGSLPSVGISNQSNSVAHNLRSL